jgi:aminoacrylate hydrolase
LQNNGAMNFKIFNQRNDADAIVVSAGLGGLSHFWHPQIEALAGEFRVIAYDQRGTGDNQAALPSPYTIGMMADDVIEILDKARIERCHFMGHALGGLVGLELALNYPERVSSLIVVNSWAAPNSHTQRCFAARRELLNKSGVDAYVNAQPIFLYPAAWLERNAAQVSREVEAGIRNFQGADNLLARMDALLRFEIGGKLGDIETPTLVAASRDDILVPWTCSEDLARKIPNAEFWVVPEGGHAFSAVDAEPFNSRVLSFLRGVAGADR